MCIVLLFSLYHHHSEIKFATSTNVSKSDVLGDIWSLASWDAPYIMLHYVTFCVECPIVYFLLPLSSLSVASYVSVCFLCLEFVFETIFCFLVFVVLIELVSLLFLFLLCLSISVSYF